MAAGETIVVRRFQAIERILQNSGKPQPLEWWQIFQEKARPAYRYRQISGVGGQKSRGDQEGIKPELVDFPLPPQKKCHSQYRGNKQRVRDLQKFGEEPV